MSYQHRQQLPKSPQHNRNYTFDPNNGPPVFATGPNPVFPANAAPPYNLHSPQTSQTQPQPQPQTKIGPLRSNRGLFDGTNWLCNCNPRKIAVKFQVKKESPNKGRWFYRCSNNMGQHGPEKCELFLWEDQETQRTQTAEFDTIGPPDTASTTGRYSTPSPLPQAVTTSAGLTTPGTTPSRRRSTLPAQIVTTPYQDSPQSSESQFYSPPASPTTFSQRIQPPRQAKSPNRKVVAFETATSEATTTDSEESDSDETDSAENESDYDTESWEDEVQSAQVQNDPSVAPIRNYGSDESTDTETDTEEFTEDDYEVQSQLNRDIFQSVQPTIQAAAPATTKPTQPPNSKPPASTQTFTQGLHPSETSDSEEDLFITPRSSAEPNAPVPYGTTAAETTTTITTTGPYTTIYHHPLPPPHRPTTPSTPRPTPNPALTASPIPEKGAVTTQLLALLSSHSVTLPPACKSEFEQLLERQYRRETANLKAKDRLRLILQEKEREIEKLRHELAEAEINRDLVPVFTKTCLVTEKKTDRTYYRRRSEVEREG